MYLVVGGLTFKKHNKNLISLSSFILLPGDKHHYDARRSYSKVTARRKKTYAFDINQTSRKNIHGIGALAARSFAPDGRLRTKYIHKKSLIKNYAANSSLNPKKGVPKNKSTNNR